MSESRVISLLEPLLERDGAGGSWLGPLLDAAPRGRARLGELVDAPGWVEAPVAVRTETGRRGAFEYTAAPVRALLAWYVDHPDELSWVDEPDASSETVRLRRVLLHDEPAGARARAQDRARELMRGPAPLGPVWWRLEEARRLDATLITNRLVLVLRDVDARGTAPATPWFPPRADLVRDLEAARRLAQDGLRYGVLGLASTAPDPDAEATAVAAAVARGAPHLDEAERAELADAYLGTVALDVAQRATAA